MNVKETISAARDSLTARRVYGEPYERNGVAVIPAAAVQGGGGGGGSEEGERSDGGSGFGLTARPVGAYVIRGDEVCWQPAFDLTRTIVGCQLLALAAIWLTHRRLGRRR
ncbi:MAG: hypothetical protein ACRDL6_11920 [Solirubrobacterales bacterium]